MKTEIRRFLVFALLTLQGALFVFEAYAASEPQKDYAVAYQNNIAHTGVLDEPGGLTPPLKKAWSINLGGGISYPLIAENMVFVTVADKTGFGTNLVALDLASGKIIWQQAISSTYSWSNAAYDQGSIYVVNSEGLLQGFVAKTGRLRWSAKSPDPSLYLDSSPPTAVNGTIFVGGSGFGRAVYAVSEATGKLLWEQVVQNGDNSSPAVDNSGVYVTYPCQGYRFRPTGNLVWNFSSGCEGGGGRTPVLYHGMVFMRDFAGPSVILQESDGKLVGDLAAIYAPAFWGDTMVFIANNALQGQSLNTGNLTWTFAGNGDLTSAALIVNGVAYEGSSHGDIYGVSVTSGEVVWQYKVPSPIIAPDEFDIFSPLTGFGAGQGTLVIPAGNELYAFTSK